MPRIALCGVATLIAALAAPASAQQEAAAPARLREVISLDAQDESIEELAAEISRQSGRTVLAAPDLDGRLTLRLERVAWRDAVSMVARLARLRVRELPGEALLLERPLRLSVQFRDADVRTVLLLLARYAERSIVLSPAVRGRINVDLRAVEPLAALRAIAETAGDYVVLGAGEALRVGAPGEVASPPPAARNDAREAEDARSDAPRRRVLEGRFRALGPEGLELERRDGVVETIALPAARAARERLRAELQRLRAGDRVTVTTRGTTPGDEPVLDGLIAPDRAR